jgi:hypothetical protein
MHQTSTLVGSWLAYRQPSDRPGPSFENRVLFIKMMKERIILKNH